MTKMLGQTFNDTLMGELVLSFTEFSTKIH